MEKLNQRELARYAELKEQEEVKLFLEYINEEPELIKKFIGLIQYPEWEAFLSLCNMHLGNVAYTILDKKLSKEEYDAKRGYYNGCLFIRDAMSMLSTVYTKIIEKKEKGAL